MVKKFRMYKWNKENFLDVEYKGKEDCKIIKKDKSTEINIILPEKPTTNKFRYQFKGHKDYNFFYQPELTQERKDRGFVRPEKVIGSYAVYHKTKKNHIKGKTNYRCGKICHIFRPKIIDNNGNWIWGELNIADDELTITVSQDFLDNAVYPVVVDPTFGFTEAGESYGAGLDDGYQWTVEESTSAGDIVSISVYIASGGEYQDDFGQTIYYRFGIYDFVDVNTAGVLLRQTEASAGESMFGEAWKTLDLESVYTVTGTTNYTLAMRIYDEGEGIATVKYDSMGGYPSEYDYGYNWSGDSNMEDPLAYGVDYYGERYSIYATYEGEEPPAGTNMEINIGDVWKDVTGVEINIADSWRTVTKVELNVGDTWKTIFS